nr:MAG TPA: hypothetical protein [Caudoviricetes sp.]
MKSHKHGIEQPEKRRRLRRDHGSCRERSRK